MELLEPLEVEKISELVYRGKYNLGKPTPSLKGVYGGNLAAQALLVAIRSSSEGFVPHSLHSFFVKSGLDDRPFTWKVEKVSDGRNFCNRLLKAVQDGEVKYVANISLTTKNSIEKQQELFSAGKSKQKPFNFGTPYPTWLSKYKPDDLKPSPRLDTLILSHRLPPEFLDLNLTALAEEKTPAAERQLSFWVKWGRSDSLVIDLPNVDEFKYLGVAYLSDSIFLTRMLRTLRIEADNESFGHYMSVSLDHIIYFHDSDFDPTKWMGFSFRSANLSNDRVLLEGEMFNENGKHVASIIQEGLLKVSHFAEKAKL